MNLQHETIVKIQNLINEETQYRSGPELVGFFNKLGFSDTYGDGFPSRWAYTQQKLYAINGTTRISECLKTLFSPIKFVGKYNNLDMHIEELNRYLLYDGYSVIRKGVKIEIVTIDESDLTEFNFEDSNDSLEIRKIRDSFFAAPLTLDSALAAVLKRRFDEIELSRKCKLSLATVLLCGSTLEGVLLIFAKNYPEEFNTAKAAPRNRNGKVLPYNKWTLANLIDVAKEIGRLNEDVKRASRDLRDFRNYIHPHLQAVEDFSPNEDTAKLSCFVLGLAISQLVKSTSNQ